jgi:hypothetical protein
MFTAGSATSDTVPPEERSDVPEKTLTEKLAETLWRVLNKQEVDENQRMEARRYQDSRDQDPDYGRRLRELEGQIQEIDREQQGFRGPHINHSEGGGKESSWKDWVLGLVGLAIVAWLGRISLQMENLQAIAVEQKMMEKHLESTDGRIDRVEARVYRGSP